MRNTYSIAKKALDFVKEVESSLGRPNFDTKGRGKGYDIKSWGPQGTRFIEIKAKSKNAPKEMPFNLTHQESILALNEENFWLYHVYNINSPTKDFKLYMIPRSVILKRANPKIFFKIKLGKGNFGQKIWEEEGVQKYP